MDSFFKALLTESPSWVQISIFIICLLGLITVFIFFILGAYRFATAVNKESKAFDLSKMNQDLVKENEKLKDDLQKSVNLIKSLSNVMEISNKQLTILHNSTFDKILDSWVEEDSTLLVKTQFFFLKNMSDIIYSSLNLAANEVNYQNRGRLSLWSLDNNNEDYLEKIYRSVQFEYSKDETKNLNIHESIAGRAFRTKNDQIVLDLTTDPDWNNINNTYKAITAYPIGESRVLTIDFKEVPNEKELDFIKQISLHIDYLYIYRDNLYDLMNVIELIYDEIFPDTVNEYDLDDDSTDDDGSN